MSKERENMLENRMIAEAYIEDDIDDEERMRIILERDDQRYEDEINERLSEK